MRSDTKHPMYRGFTLIELLIVIVILSTLATIVSTGTSDLTAKADKSYTEKTVQIIHAALDRYAAEHGAYPDRAHWRNACDSIAAKHKRGTGYTFFVNRMTLYSNQQGEVCDSRQNGKYPLGPYISNGFPPVNPENGGSSIVVLPNPGSLNSSKTYGWIYDFNKGTFEPNNGRYNP